MTSDLGAYMADWHIYQTNTSEAYGRETVVGEGVCQFQWTNVGSHSRRDAAKLDDLLWH